MFLNKLIQHRQILSVTKKCMSVQENLVDQNKVTYTDTTKESTTSARRRIKLYLRKNEQLKDMEKFIPKKYICTKKRADNLYLICPRVAETIVSHVLPHIRNNPNQLVCETNAGLGLITQSLLENGVEKVRIYEACPEFRIGLKDFRTVYSNRIELFTKDIFHISRCAYFDKFDCGNRVESLLRNVPKKSWSDEPVMTIIGTLPDLGFIKHLLQSLFLQTDIVSYGRIQLFAVMKPKDYARISAGPEDNLYAYQSWSILSHLFFDYKILDKFPRAVFFPWESSGRTPRSIYPNNLEPDLMYLVQINLKKDFPVSVENFVPFYYFVRQLCPGRYRIVPTVEKWVPGCGINIIVPKLKHTHYFEDIGIFTKFGDLNPRQILSVFHEVINDPLYEGSPFMGMVENELIKAQTIETSLNDAMPLEKNIIEDIQIKLDHE